MFASHCHSSTIRTRRSVSIEVYPNNAVGIVPVNSLWSRKMPFRYGKLVDVRGGMEPVRLLPADSRLD